MVKPLDYTVRGRRDFRAKFIHGLEHGRYYLKRGLCLSVGRFDYGIQRGRWRFIKERGFFRGYRRDVLWFTKSGKIYSGRIIPVRKYSDTYQEVICDDGMVDRIIDGIFRFIDNLLN